MSWEYHVQFILGWTVPLKIYMYALGVEAGRDGHLELWDLELARSGAAMFYPRGCLHILEMMTERKRETDEDVWEQ